MALTTLQRPDKARFENDLQRIADEMSRMMTSWELASEFINDVDGTDLTEMGITDAGSIAVMNDLKQAVNDIVALFTGTAVTPIKSPKEVMDKVRRMMPV